MPRHTRHVDETPRPERGKSRSTSASSCVEELLASLGIASVATFDSVDATVDAQLAKNGHKAKVLSISFGVLTLLAENPVVARQLFYEVDVIRDAVNAVLPELGVQRVVVRSSAA